MQGGGAKPSFAHVVNALYDAWDSSTGVDLLLLILGSSYENLAELQSSQVGQFQTLMFPKILLGTAVLFTKSDIHVLAHKKHKVNIDPCSNVIPRLPVVFHDKSTGMEGACEEIFSTTTADTTIAALTYGGSCAFTDGILNCIKEKGATLIEGPNAIFSTALSRAYSKGYDKAGLSGAVKYTKAFSKIIEEKVVNLVDRPFGQGKFSDDVNRHVKQLITKIQKQEKLNQPKSDPSLLLPCIVQCGPNVGVHGIDPLKKPSDEKVVIEEPCFIVRSSLKTDCCITFGRTYFINPDSEVRRVFNGALELRKKIISSITPGRKLKELYTIAVDFLENSEWKDLVKYLYPTVAFVSSNTSAVMDSLVSEKSINEDAAQNKSFGYDFVLKNRDLITTWVGFQGLRTKEGKLYDILLADSCIVREGRQVKEEGGTVDTKELEKSQAPLVLTEKLDYKDNVDFDFAKSDEADKKDGKKSSKNGKEGEKDKKQNLKKTTTTMTTMMKEIKEREKEEVVVIQIVLQMKDIEKDQILHLYQMM